MGSNLTFRQKEDHKYYVGWNKRGNSSLDPFLHTGYICALRRWKSLDKIPPRSERSKGTYRLQKWWSWSNDVRENGTSRT